jgi:murein DD-endopeptidase MepM/ murein hydrolase activator NlpD
MLSRRYTILVADRSSGVVRRMTVSLRALLAVSAGVLAVPVVLGIGARASVSADLSRLQATNASLELENQSYRAATGQLANQIASLQTVLSDLGDKSRLDPATTQAIDKLPAIVKNRAMGGSPSGPEAAKTLLTMLTSPDNTFGVLRTVLDSLENRLRLVRTDMSRVEALAHATPSIWPAVGWLTDGFGTRTNPVTGNQGTHEGLDISGDKGDPVFAAASGTVQTAGWSGDFGNLVVVTHEFGLVTRYAHLSKINVKPGDAVNRGQVIGQIGSTGRSTGPHLHYEVWANGRPIDPLALLTGQQRR